LASMHDGDSTQQERHVCYNWLDFLRRCPMTLVHCHAKATVNGKTHYLFFSEQNEGNVAMSIPVEWTEDKQGVVTITIDNYAQVCVSGLAAIEASLANSTIALSIPDSSKPASRLAFDPEALTITLDGKDYQIDEPKAFAIYQVIAQAPPS